MTKFEEDLNKKMDLKEVPMYFTQFGCSMTRKTYIETNWIFDNYGNYHSDEEFHELSEKLDDTNDALVIAQNSRDEFEREYKKLKSQLQQQALPVVPECVAEFVELLKKNPETLWSKLYSSLGEEGVDWLNEFQHKDERFGIGGLNHKLFVLFHLAINGYTVEKQQLFYLKHIDMSKNDEQVDWYMSKAHRRVGHNSCEKRKLPIYDSFKFTQQEIDSMETGSYEQIEVTE